WGACRVGGSPPLSLGLVLVVQRCCRAWTMRCCGVQRSALLLLAARGHIRGFDSAIFADTGWEPLAVYRHLNRLARIAGAAGIPVVRVSRGHIRRDAINP